MSLLNSIGGHNHPWAAAKIAANTFSRADTNGDASLDKTELQATFDKVAAKTGNPAGDAEAVIARIDRNGDGAVTRLEIRAHLRELRAAPSTVELARQSGESSAG